jgi:hypothetical protein
MMNYERVNTMNRGDPRCNATHAPSLGYQLHDDDFNAFYRHSLNYSRSLKYSFLDSPRAPTGDKFKKEEV